MSDNLSFKEEDLYNFLFRKIIELQTETFSQKMLLTALYKHVHPESLETFEKMEQALKEQKELLFQDRAQTFVAELKSISGDFDNLIQSLINPK